MSSPPVGERPGGLSRDDFFRALGALGAILTVVTAVLFYFGWRRSEAQSRAMSIDVSLFGFTSQDYVLRSISSLYLPLLLVAALGLCWSWSHRRLTAGVATLAATDDRRRTVALRWARWLAVGGTLVAAGCLAFTLLAGFEDPWPPVTWLAQRLAGDRWVIPALLLLGAVVALYAAWVAKALGPGREPGDGPGFLAAALVGVIVVLSLFWLLEEYAAAVGRGYAQRLVEDVDSLPRATVTSPQPLAIEAPGVAESPVTAAPGAAPQYRTTGLRLLARSGTKILLVHDGWTPGTGVVVVLPDSDTYTWQFGH